MIGLRVMDVTMCLVSQCNTVWRDVEAAPRWGYCMAWGEGVSVVSALLPTLQSEC